MVSVRGALKSALCVVVLACFGGWSHGRERMESVGEKAQRSDLVIVGKVLRVTTDAVTMTEPMKKRLASQREVALNMIYSIGKDRADQLAVGQKYHVLRAHVEVMECMKGKKRVGDQVVVDIGIAAAPAHFMREGKLHFGNREKVFRGERAGLLLLVNPEDGINYRAVFLGFLDSTTDDSMARFTAFVRASAGSGGHELAFRQDGDDLVVTLRTAVNNSPHVVVTRHSKLTGGAIELGYTVFQNQSLIVRSKKEIAVEWRLPKHTKTDPAKYRVLGARLQLTSSEIRTLLDKGQSLLPKDQKPSVPAGSQSLLWIDAKDAERSGSAAASVQIREEGKNVQFGSYISSKWQYNFKLYGPGRSGCRTGTLLLDGKHVRGEKAEEIMTPFGRMRFVGDMDPKAARQYRAGWHLVEE